MSHNVTFVAIRKEDHCPMLEGYLGGNRVADSVSWSENFDNFITNDEERLLKLKDAKEAMNFFVWHEDCFYLGNDKDACLKFIAENQDACAYFVRDI